jgi:metallo-beta-lactamase family protein
MKLKFCGAAQTVTGSSHLLTLEVGTNILVECGLYQGRESQFENFNENWLVPPEDIDILVVSHAHIDHTGRIPKFVKDGFKGEIVCTHATRDLCTIMLLDSAYIQEKDVIYINKRKARLGLKPIKPLYTVEDANNCFGNFVGLSYNRWHRIDKSVEVMFRDAGHILGSANVTLKIEMPDRHYKYVGFTGDIGRPERPILRDPQPMPNLDYLICESTYGGKSHQGLPSNVEELYHIIHRACVEKKGKLVIPAFSVGRTQEIVYMLDQLENEGRLPHIPVYVDSPLAVNATEIFNYHPECFDKDILEYMHKDPNPFGFNNLNYVRSVEESKAINEKKGPAIIISASGMMSAGRIKHHLSNTIESSKNTILVVGYCSEGTLGARLRDGDKDVRIFGEQKKVKAEIKILDSFSAHGDEGEMLAFLDNLNRDKLKKLFLVHGDLKRQELFKSALKGKRFRNIEIPHLGQSYNINK